MKEVIIVATTLIVFFLAVALVSDGDIRGWFDKYIILWN